MRKIVFAMAASAALGLSACSALGRAAFREPVVELKSVALKGVGLTGGTLDVQLSVYNPNGFRLDATKLRYKVAMAGDSITVADGTLDNRFTVDEKQTSVVTIPVNFTYAGIGAAGRSLLNTGAVDYRVSGDVVVGSPVGNVTVPYSTKGRFTTTGAAK